MSLHPLSLHDALPICHHTHLVQSPRTCLEEQLAEKIVRYFARFTAATRNGYGSIAFPFHHSLSGPNSAIAKCKCGERGSAFPVDPTKPMTSPRSTRIPSRNPSAYPSKCA